MPNPPERRGQAEHVPPGHQEIPLILPPATTDQPAGGYQPYLPPPPLTVPGAPTARSHEPAAHEVEAHEVEAPSLAAEPEAPLGAEPATDEAELPESTEAEQRLKARVTSRSFVWDTDPVATPQDLDPAVSHAPDAEPLEATAPAERPEAAELPEADADSQLTTLERSPVTEEPEGAEPAPPTLASVRAHTVPGADPLGADGASTLETEPGEPGEDTESEAAATPAAAGTRQTNTYSLDQALARGFRTPDVRRVWRRFTSAQLHLAALLISVAVAAFTRLPALGAVRRIAFDETYYVKDSYSLWHLGYEGRWADNVNDAFLAGDYSGLSAEGAFVVHPQLGKWLIGIGPEILGWNNPGAWRLMPAIAGIVMVALICVIARQLFASPLMTLFAGLFLAVDGVAVSVSRIALLDVFAAVFLLAGFATLIRDQQDWHARLAHHARLHCGDLSVAEKFSLLRPWLIATGVLWGLAAGVKWNALYVIAAGGLYVFIREVSARITAGMGIPEAFARAVTRGGIPAFIQLVPTAFVVYLATWTSWFLHPRAYGHGGTGKTGVLGAIADFVKYQRDTLTFHEGVTSTHRYQANALQWIFDLRPTSMMWVSDKSTGTELVRASSSLGNPAMWWLGVAALAFVVVMAGWMRDWRAGLIVCGYAGTWLPWFIYWDRTIFMFYTIVLVPFVVLAVVYLLGTFTGSVTPRAWPLIAWEERLAAPMSTTSTLSRAVGLGIAALIVVVGLFFVPVTAAWEIPRDHWQWRMWLTSWI